MAGKYRVPRAGERSMSKESGHALDCPGCGQRMFYTDYHIPHCKNTNNNQAIARMQNELVSQKPKEGKGVPASSVAGNR